MRRSFNEAPFKQLICPDDPVYDQVAANLKLEPHQKTALTHRVSTILSECATFHKRQNEALENGIDAAALLAKAERISSLLSDLEKEFSRSPMSLSAIGTAQNFGAIGLLLSFEAIAAAVSTDELDCDVRSELEEIEHKRAALSSITGRLPQPIGLLEFERELSSGKEKIDFHHRADLLMHVVRSMREQFEGFLAPIREEKDRGGAYFDPVRRHFIHALACDSRQILGRPIRKTGGVAFLNLCDQVFKACGLSVVGLEDAIKDYLAIPSAWKEIAYYNGLEA